MMSEREKEREKEREEKIDRLVTDASNLWVVRAGQWFMQPQFFFPYVTLFNTYSF